MKLRLGDEKGNEMVPIRLDWRWLNALARVAPECHCLASLMSCYLTEQMPQAADLTAIALQAGSTE
jgi:hypothetical protein